MLISFPVSTLWILQNFWERNERKKEDECVSLEARNVNFKTTKTNSTCLHFSLTSLSFFLSFFLFSSFFLSLFLRSHPSHTILSFSNCLILSTRFSNRIWFNVKNRVNYLSWLFRVFWSNQMSFSFSFLLFLLWSSEMVYLFPNLFSDTTFFIKEKERDRQDFTQIFCFHSSIVWGKKPNRKTKKENQMNEFFFLAKESNRNQSSKHNSFFLSFFLYENVNHQISFPPTLSLIVIEPNWKFFQWDWNRSVQLLFVYSCIHS